MTGKLTDARVQSLADLACASRPYGAPTWDPPGVVAAIRRLMERGLGMQEVIDRVLAHAWDATAKTPGTILTPKSRKPLEESTHPFPVRSRGSDVAECRLHIGLPAAACPACAADALVGDTTPPPTRQEPPSYDDAGRPLKHRPLRELVQEFTQPEEKQC